MECEDGSDNHLDGGACDSGNKRVTFSPTIIVLNSDQGDGDISDSETNLEADEELDSSDTESSSSSSSSIDDFIPINSQILLNSNGESNTPQPNGSKKLLYGNEKYEVTSEAIYRSAESVSKSPESTSQSSDVTHESSMERMLPTLSPSIQVMEWPEGFDRNRISASHSSRHSTPIEGSATSDDSLFSIHIKNKGEDASWMDSDVYKSEEWPKSRELFKAGESYQSGGELNRKSDTAKAVDEDVKPGEKGTVDEPINDRSRPPMKTETSIQPTASPIKKKSSCGLHHCPDCLVFRCFKWPSRCSSRWIRWPSCSIRWFVQPSCLGNCLSWLGCCCKWPTCHCKCSIWSSCHVRHKCWNCTQACQFCFDSSFVVFPPCK